MKKQIISIITAIAMTISLCSVVLAENGLNDDEEIRGDFVYKKGTNTITAYIGDSGVCELPEGVKLYGPLSNRAISKPAEKLIVNKDVQGLVLMPARGIKEVEFKEGITEIADFTLSQWSGSKVEKITFPSTLKKIGDNTFNKIPNLKTIEFPDGLESIGEESFKELKSLSGDLIIPDSVTNMGHGTFADCGDLDKVHLSDNITYTQDPMYPLYTTSMWFYHTNIKEINIPSSIIRDKNCEFSADEITFDGDMTEDIYKMVVNSNWCQEKFLKGKSNKNKGDNTDFIIVDNVLYRYNGKDRNPVIPEGVKTIAEGAFNTIDIDTVILPKSLETIKAYAFQRTTLKEITIPENIKTIEQFAFFDCPLIEKAIFEGLPEEETWDIFDSVYLSIDDYKENIVYTKGETPKYLYSWCFAYNLKLFYENLNEYGGYDLKWDNDYIVAPSHIAENLEAVNTPKATPTPKPQTTAEPKATAKPVATEAPQETPEPQTLSVHGGDKIGVSVNDKAVTFPDAQPFIDDNDRTQIPIRAVADMLSCKVDWDKDARTVTITSDNGGVVVLTIDSSIMNVDDNAIQMDTAAIIKDDRTYIPVRFVAEAMGLMVEWEK